MPHHILVACHAWYGDITGGSFRLASEFADGLAAAGHQVHYLCCENRATHAPGSEVQSERLTIHRYPAPRPSMPGFLKLRYHLRQTILETRRLHDQCGFAAASLHSPLQGLGVLTALKGTDVLTNYTVHSPFDDELLSNLTDKPSMLQWLAVRQARRIDRKSCRFAMMVQGCSRYTLRVLQGRHDAAIQNKGIVAPGWVDGDRFQPAADRRQTRRDLSDTWNTDCPIFFTLRRLENRMGLETLVEASRLLKSRGTSFRVLIGGGGSLKSRLEQQIAQSGLQNHVFLLGRLPEEQLPLVYAAADCFVLPTKALECFGLIVLEAFACNTPVIASNVAAIPELAEQQGDGWMFEPGHAEQLANRMQAFLERRLQPTVNLREIALKYDKAKVLKEWERVLLGVARG